jgi:hypothetical protein
VTFISIKHTLSGTSHTRARSDGLRCVVAMSRGGSIALLAELDELLALPAVRARRSPPQTPPQQCAVLNRSESPGSSIDAAPTSAFPRFSAAEPPKPPLPASPAPPVLKSVPSGSPSMSPSPGQAEPLPKRASSSQQARRRVSVSSRGSSQPRGGSLPPHQHRHRNQRPSIDGRGAVPPSRRAPTPVPGRGERPPTPVVSGRPSHPEQGRPKPNRESSLSVVPDRQSGARPRGLAVVVDGLRERVSASEKQVQQLERDKARLERQLREIVRSSQLPPSEETAPSRARAPSVGSSRARSSSSGSAKRSNSAKRSVSSGKAQKWASTLDLPSEAVVATQSLKRRANQLTAASKDLKRRLEASHKRCEALKSQQGEASRQLELVRSQREEARKEVGALKRRMAVLKNQLSAKTKLQEQSKSDCEELASRSESQAGRIRELERALAKERSLRADADSEASELRMSLRKLAPCRSKCWRTSTEVAMHTIPPRRELPDETIPSSEVAMLTIPPRRELPDETIPSSDSGVAPPRGRAHGSTTQDIRMEDGSSMIGLACHDPVRRLQASHTPHKSSEATDTGSSMTPLAERFSKLRLMYKRVYGKSPGSEEERL